MNLRRGILQDKLLAKGIYKMGKRHLYECTIKEILAMYYSHVVNAGAMVNRRQ